MPDIASFLLGSLALLATPGPTNTLLAASGAVLGVRASLRLIPAELAGYLIAIGLLSLLIVPLMARLPVLAPLLKGAAALFLVWSAISLWRAAGRIANGAPPPATPRRVFLTTLLNPKAIVFAIVLFPGRDPAWSLPLFSGLVTSVAFGWILIGHGLGRIGGATRPTGRVNRLTALILGVFAVLVAGSALSGG